MFVFVEINIIKISCSSQILSNSTKMTTNTETAMLSIIICTVIFLRYENRDTEHLIQCQAVFVCSSPSNGRCHDCKVYQSLFVFTVDVWDPTVLPYFGHIPLQHWSNQWVIFSFGLWYVGDGLVAYFDHIPHPQICPVQSSQVKKTAGHPLFIKEIILSSPHQRLLGENVDQ